MRLDVGCLGGKKHARDFLFLEPKTQSFRGSIVLLGPKNDDARLGAAGLFDEGIDGGVGQTVLTAQHQGAVDAGRDDARSLGNRRLDKARRGDQEQEKEDKADFHDMIPQEFSPQIGGPMSRVAAQ